MTAKQLERQIDRLKGKIVTRQDRISQLKAKNDQDKEELKKLKNDLKAGKPARTGKMKTPVGHSDEAE